MSVGLGLLLQEPDFRGRPTIDGSKYGLVDRPIELIRRKQVAPVPVIMGINRDEGVGGRDLN